MDINDIERQLHEHVGRDMLIESVVDGKPLGGEGVIVEVYHDRGDLWVAVDWGMAWIVRREGFKLETVSTTT